VTNRNHPLTLSIAVALAVTVLTAPTRAALESWQVAVGYQQLLDARGPVMPAGATPGGNGTSISQVEVPQGTQTELNNGQGRYFPDTAAPEFAAAGDPLNQAVNFVDGNGYAANGVSSHAGTQVGRYYYGNFFGLGKSANEVVAYDVQRWFNDQLKVGANAEPNLHTTRLSPSDPYVEHAVFQVQNHSWVSSQAQGTDLDALRRFDYAIETDDMTAVVGANNNFSVSNPNLAHPTLMAHSYNAIVAGITSAAHSRGATGAVYGPGRYRPDLVAPGGLTSVGTAQISSAATLLRGVVAGTDADSSEVTKAMLLAGATKSEFAGYVEQATSVANPWNRTATRPLDDVFGAGELNVYNSYLMTVGGQHAGSTSPPAAPVASYGWDYQDRKADAGVGEIYYNFEIPTGSTASELSIMLSWNVKVTDTNPSPSVFTPQESLQNLDLTLYNSTASFMATQIDQSISTLDNVEHIYQTNLGPGIYTLKVTGAANWDYGLAWRMSTAFDVADADFDDNGFFGGGDFLVWQRNLGKLVGATNAEGDADGDGDVDNSDLTLLNAAITNQSTPPMVLNAVAAVPEPATLGAAAVGAALLALAGRSKLGQIGRRRTA
jgi:hypothetical protein